MNQLPVMQERQQAMSPDRTFQDRHLYQHSTLTTYQYKQKERLERMELQGHLSPAHTHSQDVEQPKHIESSQEPT